MGKIPRDLFEDELVPLFEKAGPIWDLRLMMDPLSSLNRGYAFVTFCAKDSAQEAVKLVGPPHAAHGPSRPSSRNSSLSSSAITLRFGPANTSASAYLWPTTGCLSAPYPKAKPRSRSWRSFLRSQVRSAPGAGSDGSARPDLQLCCVRPEGLSDVILYHQPDDKKKNRGFCFLEYEDHKTAAQARRRLMSGKVKVWGNLVTVEWADPIEDPDPEVMAKVSQNPEVNRRDEDELQPGAAAMEAEEAQKTPDTCIS